MQDVVKFCAGLLIAILLASACLYAAANFLIPQWRAFEPLAREALAR
jgi:hypothetical protein